MQLYKISWISPHCGPSSVAGQKWKLMHVLRELHSPAQCLVSQSHIPWPQIPSDFLHFSAWEPKMLGSEGQRLFFSQITKCRCRFSQSTFFTTYSELEWRSNSALSVSLTTTLCDLTRKNCMQIDFLHANMHKFSRQITKCGSKFSHLTIFLTLATNPLGFSSFFCMGAKNARIRRPETWVTTWIALSRVFQSPQ